jgi:hypothetical protein
MLGAAVPESVSEQRESRPTRSAGVLKNKLLGQWVDRIWNF